jgi:hypothetical protein
VHSDAACLMWLGRMNVLHYIAVERVVPGYASFVRTRRPEIKKVQMQDL